MRPSEHEQLIEHMHWADAVVWRAVLATPAARENEEMRRRLHHLHLVQHLYVQIWRGEPMQLTEPTDFRGLDAIRAWAEPVYPRARAFVRSLDAARMQDEVTFPWEEQVRASLGVFHAATVAQTIVQVASHSTYHRGQLCADLRRLGGEPPLTDFIAWVWQGQPQGDAVPVPSSA